MNINYLSKEKLIKEKYPADRQGNDLQYDVFTR